MRPLFPCSATVTVNGRANDLVVVLGDPTADSDCSYGYPNLFHGCAFSASLSPVGTLVAE